MQVADTLFRQRPVQDMIDGEGQPAVAAYSVSDGVDCCMVGYLPIHLIKHKARYIGKLYPCIGLLDNSDKQAEQTRPHQNYWVDCFSVTVLEG
eukprot:scaffold5169_cov172-Amphora_coffeaeformis.AAC.38